MPWRRRRKKKGKEKKDDDQSQTHKNQTEANHKVPRVPQNSNWQNFPLMPNLDSEEFEKMHAAAKQDSTAYATLPFSWLLAPSLAPLSKFYVWELPNAESIWLKVELTLNSTVFLWINVCST